MFWLRKGLISILSLGIENIKQKIEDLKALGFTDPNKLITSSPVILGLGIENISKKVDTVQTIFKLYDIKLDANQFIEKNLNVLSAKIDRVWIIARVLRTLDFKPDQITASFLSKLLFSNITNVTVATSLLNQEGGQNFTNKEVLEAIKKAKSMSKDEKDNIIENEVDPKLSHRYERGYGKS